MTGRATISSDRARDKYRIRGCPPRATTILAHTSIPSQAGRVVRSQAFYLDEHSTGRPVRSDRLSEGDVKTKDFHGQPGMISDFRDFDFRLGIIPELTNLKSENQILENSIWELTHPKF